MSAGPLTCPSALPSKDTYAVPSLQAHVTEQIRLILQVECLLPTSPVPSRLCFVLDPESSQPSSAREHPRCSTRNRIHPAAQHNSGSRPDSSPDVVFPLALPPKTRVLFFAFSILIKIFFTHRPVRFREASPSGFSYSPTIFLTKPNTSPGSA